MIDLSYENRFGGLERIYGTGALKTLKQAHVMVVGLGGVGSWTVEALARSGVGTLTLVDLDDVCATNTNRQLHALDPEWGRLKVEVLADRVRKINPEAQVHVRADFFTDRSAPSLLAPRPDLIVDAIDSVNDKVALVRHGRAEQIRLILCGGAGGKTDPTRVRFGDLGDEQGDALLKAVKRGLKAEGMGPDDRGHWGLECVYSLEPPVMPWEVCEAVRRPNEGGAARIDCEGGFGAAAFATGAFGFCLASRTVYRLLCVNS
jgi:tRNA A37 threonylcarbamoyladenosine dehydratase